MNEDREYKSSLACHMRGLIASKQSCGFDYSAQTYMLERLDRFCINRNFSEPMVTMELAQSWAEAIPTEGGASRSSRMSILRQLALYERSCGMDAYIPRNFSTREKPCTYIPTLKETRHLFEVIDTYTDKRYWYMASGYRIAFRLMRYCGMRISECANMAMGDVDVEGATLLIKHSKGDKDRIVYMANDMAAMVLRHIKRLQSGLGFLPDWLFPGKDLTNHIRKNTFDMKFAQFWSKVPGASMKNKHPTPHSLRHAFVVDRMNRWMEEGVDLGQMMPYLASYLGHDSANETFYYYHQIEEASSIVRARDTVSARVIPEVVFYEA